MGMKRWNAEQWHRQHSHRRLAEGRRGAWRAFSIVGALAVVALATGAVSVAEFSEQGQEKIVVCHATGSAEQPFVRLVVDKDGFEHGHHRHHEGDFFKESVEATCDDDSVEPPVNATEPEPTPTEGPAPTNGSEAPSETENATAPPQEEEPAPEPAVNETEPEPLPPGDAAVAQSVDQDAERVSITLAVSNVAEGDSRNVRLVDELPDVRRAWLLGGADATKCTLDGRSLECFFGILEPGATRTVTLSAYTDRMPCGNHLTNTAVVSAEEDAQATNDRASGGIAARAC